MKRLLQTSTTLSLVALLSACGTSHKQQVEAFNIAYKNSDYCQATDVVLSDKGICQKEVKDINIKSYDIDKQINAGTTLFLAGKHPESMAFFEQASTGIQESLDSNGIARGTAEVVANASAVDYSPMIMDSVYLHSYQVLNALKLEDKSEAKIQINRAYNTQQNAVQEFSKEINKQKEELAKDNAGLNEKAVVSTQENSAEILKNYSDLNKWKGYTNFVNPYTTYISGLYFMLNSSDKSDYETASTYMKRVAGMTNGNKFVKQDLDLTQKLANGQIKKINPTAWVVFENGKVADFDEFRIDLPVFIATDAVKTASLSLPKPKEREAAFSSIEVSSNGKNKVKTQVLTDVDSIFISEFNKKLPTIVGKAVAKLTFQTVLQATAQEQFGDLGGISASVYSVMTAGADLRSWYSLPKNVQLAKVAKSKDGQVYLYAGGKEIAKVETPKDSHSLIYVRIPQNDSVPVISTFEL